MFLCQNKEWTAGEVEGFSLARYQLGRDPQGQLCHPYLRRYESAVLHGQAALREAMRLRTGIQPRPDHWPLRLRQHALSKRSVATSKISWLLRVVLPQPRIRCGVWQ